jgi:hypothetical protein
MTSPESSDRSGESDGAIEPANPSNSTWSAGFVIAATASLGCAFAIQKLRAFDYWWHLRTGQLIA